MKFIALATFTVALSSWGATTLVEYNFNGAAPATATIASTDLATDPIFAPDVQFSDLDSASNLTAGPGFSGVTFVTNAFGDYIQVAEGNGLNDGTLDDIIGALDLGDYVEFTISDTDTINLDSLSFDFVRALRGPNDYGVFTSVDSFTANIASSGNQAASTDLADLDTGVALETISLSGAQFQGLNSITFRIVLDDRENNGGGGSAGILDDIILTGHVVPVPEPASTALIGLGGIALIGRRKRA